MKFSELKITKPVDKNWGIPRSEMPQIKTSDYPEFLDYLDSHGVRFSKQTVPADSLKPIQGEFSDAGVEKALNLRKLDKPSIVSSDDHIIDGHHRWLAALNTKQDVNIYKTNIPAHELLDLVHDFPEVYYKDMYERKLTGGEKRSKEAHFKKLKKNKGDFEKRYGKDAESVMHAVATKQAKEEVEINELSR